MSTKEKLSFTISGRKFSYEGQTANRQRDLLNLLDKENAAKDVILQAVRDNLPEWTANDADVIAEFTRQKEAKAAAKAAKKAVATAAPPPEPPVAVAQVAPVEQVAPVVPPPRPATHTDPRPIADAGSNPQEREKLMQFIHQVLNEGPTDLASTLRAQPQVSNGRPPPIQATPAPTPPAESTMAPGTGAASGVFEPPGGPAKLSVYMSADGSDATKILMVLPRTAFLDFSAAVERKWSRRMRMFFIDGDDKVEVDDDDSLEMFLSQPVAKLKLKCTPFDFVEVLVEDHVTMGHPQTAIAGAAAIPGIAPGGGGAAAAVGGGAASPPMTTSSQPQPGNAAVTAGTVPPEVPKTELHKELKTFHGHTNAVYSCAFAPGGERFATASRDKSVRVWNATEGSNKVMKGGEHSGYVLSCDFSPNGETVVSSSDDSTVRLWSATTCQKLHTLKSHSDKVYCTQFSPTGAHILSGSCDRTVRVWNTETASKVATLKGHSLAIFSCCFSNTDGGKHCLSGSDDRMIKMWDWRENREVRTFSGHGGTVWSCRFSNSDRYIISASMNQELKLWDAGSGQLIRNFAGHMASIHHALFTSNDKYVLSCARDWTVMVWETETGNHVDTLTGHINTVYNMDIQGNMLLTSSLDETVKLWQLNLP